MDSSHSPNKAVIGVIVIALLAIAATAAIVLGQNNTSKDTNVSDTASASVSPQASTTTQPTNAPTNFKSGTYNATGSYQTPGGLESIAVSVTLGGDGTITDATVTPEGKTGEAQEYQDKFVSGFKSQVVGKKIGEVQLSRVAGSSLTSGGFNDAIADIEKQANA